MWICINNLDQVRNLIGSIRSGCSVLIYSAWQGLRFAKELYNDVLYSILSHSLSCSNKLFVLSIMSNLNMIHSNTFLQEIRHLHRHHLGPLVYLNIISSVMASIYAGSPMPILKKACQKRSQVTFRTEVNVNRFHVYFRFDHELFERWNPGYVQLTEMFAVTCTQIITKTRLFKYIKNFTTKTGKFSGKKKSDIFHISAPKHRLWYRGGSNEYQQSMFWSRNKINNVYSFYYIKVGFKGVKII